MDPFVDGEPAEVRDQRGRGQSAPGFPIRDPGIWRNRSTSIPFGTTSTGWWNGLRDPAMRSSAAAAEGAVAISHLQYVPRLYHHATRKNVGTRNFAGTLSSMSRILVWKVPTRGRPNLRDVRKAMLPSGPGVCRWITSASLTPRELRSNPYGQIGQRYCP